jgi:Protein of unknown function (DUF3558)
MSIRLLGCMLAVLALSLAGCGESAGGVADPDLSSESGVLSAEAEARGPSTADAIDACALIDEAEVRSLIGDTKRTATPGNTGGDGGGCTWENQTDYKSVSVDIGRSGSAAGGALPTWDPAMGPERPLPDGMRSLSGSVDFVAGDRYCNVQVARVQGDADEQKAVELARELRGL